MNLTLKSRVGLIVAVVVAVIVFYVGREYWERPDATAGRSFAPTIGGPFTLVDHTGKTVSEKDFQGRLVLIYFGYTFCPDVCPTALTTMADALDILGDDAAPVTPVFVSVDPERDTPEHLAMYVEHFHPRLIGLTGTAEQVKAAAKAYRVYYAKAKEDGADEDDYLMDHTSITYLMGRDGSFRVHFGHATDAETMVTRIREYL